MPIQKQHIMAQGCVFRFFAILGIARYACGCKNALALPGTKIYHFWMDTNYGYL
jgi:hypothetical protein